MSQNDDLLAICNMIRPGFRQLIPSGAHYEPIVDMQLEGRRSGLFLYVTGPGVYLPFRRALIWYTHSPPNVRPRHRRTGEVAHKVDEIANHDFTDNPEWVARQVQRLLPYFDFAEKDTTRELIFSALQMP